MILPAVPVFGFDTMGVRLFYQRSLVQHKAALTMRIAYGNDCIKITVKKLS